MVSSCRLSCTAWAPLKRLNASSPTYEQFVELARRLRLLLRGRLPGELENDVLKVHVVGMMMERLDRLTQGPCMLAGRGVLFFLLSWNRERARTQDEDD